MSWDTVIAFLAATAVFRITGVMASLYRVRHLRRTQDRLESQPLVALRTCGICDGEYTASAAAGCPQCAGILADMVRERLPTGHPLKRAQT